jgi:hypothetical protein
MTPRTDQVSRLPFAIAEAAVVKNECGQTGLGKPLGKWLQSERALSTKAVRHKDNGRPRDRFWKVKPGSTAQAI